MNSLHAVCMVKKSIREGKLLYSFYLGVYSFYLTIHKESTLFFPSFLWETDTSRNGCLTTNSKYMMTTRMKRYHNCISIRYSQRRRSMQIMLIFITSLAVLNTFSCAHTFPESCLLTYSVYECRNAVRSPGDEKGKVKQIDWFKIEYKVKEVFLAVRFLLSLALRASKIKLVPCLSNRAKQAPIQF